MAGITAPADNVELPETTVAADGWFPAISTESIRKTIRLGEGTVTPERLVAAIEGAMVTAFRDLADWRTARAMAGAATLADVTEVTINGINQAELIWQRIIRYYAAAELADLHVDVSATNEALDREEEKRETANDYRRMAYHAVADLLAIGAAESDLIQRNRVKLL